MVAPAIAAGAAGAARTAAVLGRTAVGASRTAGTAGQATIKSRLQQSRAFDQNLLQRQPATRTQEDDETVAAQPGASRVSQFKAATSAIKQFNAMQAATPKEASATQEAAKAAAKKMVPKAAMMIANGIASALELGTAGIAFLVTFFIRFITLGWYNVEMIYGGWIMKGKHKLIGPLTWDPIKVPWPQKPKGQNATIPMIGVILTDMAVIFAIILSVVIMMLPYLVLGVFVSKLV